MLKLVLPIAVVLVSSSVSGEEPQFNNERANKAAAAYQAKLKEAREAYIKELDVAIKEAGGAGDLDDANKLADLKEVLEKENKLDDRDPLAAVRKELEGTTWKPITSPPSPRAFNRFRKDNKTVNHNGVEGVWIVTDENTAVMQNYNSANIFVFKFDKGLKTATVYMFEKSEKNKPTTFKRR